MSQFIEGQRVKLVGYDVYSFRTDGKVGLNEVHGVVTSAGSDRPYSVLVRVDDEYFDREYFDPFIDEITGKAFDFSFTEDGRYITDDPVVLQAVE